MNVEKAVWRTPDGDLVDEDVPDGSVLVYAAGTFVPDDQAKKLGLLKTRAKPADKARAKPEDK